MTTTPRQLYDAAINAGLEMQGLDDPAGYGSMYVWTRPTAENVGRVASLADVECAVEAALNNGGTGYTESTPSYDRVRKRHIFVRPVWLEWCYGNASGEDGFQAFELGTGDNGGEELSAFTKVYPTRADALMAACEAIAKERK